jgi:solute carrier family 25 citrate transporter 1
MPSDTPRKPKEGTPPIVSLISGGVAGGVEAAATYPCDFAKTRVQLTDHAGCPPPRNPFYIISQTYRNEGLRALYKGCPALVIGSVAKDGVRFLTFDTVKNAFRNPETGVLSPDGNLLAGMSAGVVASVFAVTPTERIKTALIDDARGSKRYQGSWHAVRMIVKEDGFLGLYRGFAGTTLKQAGATGVRMGFYNIIKEEEETMHIRQTPIMNFLNGALAGTITTLATQPFDTVKTRSQCAEGATTMQAVIGIWKDGGLKAFWRGTVMRLGRTVFSGGE